MILLHICTKFRKNTWMGFRVICTITQLKFRWGINPSKIQEGLRFLLFANCRMVLIFVPLYQVLWKYVKEFQSYGADTVSPLKFSKGRNYFNTNDKVTVLHLHTLSDYAVYLYQISQKYVKAFCNYWGDTLSLLRFSKG